MEKTADNMQLIDVYPIVGGNIAKVYNRTGDYVDEYCDTIRS